MAAPKYIVSPVTVEEALERLKRHVAPVKDVERVHVMDAVGRVLSRDVIAEHDYPPRPRAAYDGYAVRSDDTPGRLRLVGEATIGRVDVGLRVEPGTAVYVSTGAYLPEGADAVVPEEVVKVEEGFIVVDRKFEKWKNVDPPGSYVKRGSILLRRGWVVTPLDVVGLLDVGVTEVEVYRKLRLALVITGSELFEPAEPQRDRERIMRGEVAETTGRLLEWMINRYTPWVQVTGRIMVPDVVDVVEWYVARYFRDVDIVVMTGGTGPSSVDPFYQVVDRLKAKLLFRGLRVRGGRPTSAAVLEDGRLLIALSGHPISALHGFLRLLYPLLRYMGNVEVSVEPPLLLRARLAVPLKPARPEPLKVVLELAGDEYRALPLPRERQLSSVIVSNVEADGIALVDPREYREGDTVPVMVYREPSRGKRGSS